MRCVHSIIQWSRIRAYLVDIAGTERSGVRLKLHIVTTTKVSVTPGNNIRKPNRKK
jgi:hypothetical protein